MRAGPMRKAKQAAPIFCWQNDYCCLASLGLIRGTHDAGQNDREGAECDHYTESGA